MSDSRVEAVRAYYDRNTAKFERLGQGGASIHRAVWGEGVTTRAQAFHFVDERIRSVIAETKPRGARVLDLGCGLGESLLWLARGDATLSGAGVTLSGVQAARTAQRLRDAGLAARLTALEADFTRLPASLEPFDVAYAIESFVHCPDPQAFFTSVARCLVPGGRLVICDDFQARQPRSVREERWLHAIRHGWMGHGLTLRSNAVALARNHALALEEDLDLTPLLELARPRDRLISAFLTLTRPLRLNGYYYRSLDGGDALQKALLARLVEYRILVLTHVTTNQDSV
jgi:cyclopropane fatty-acyl-phospholipid synthase-like methyltransferase